MNYKNFISDSGSYINGQYQTKNGFTGLGLNCPRGTSLYDTSVIPGIYFEPNDKQNNEEFEIIKPNVVQNIAPYYLISTLGRVYNFRSEKYMKQNFRPNGYGYFCFATTEVDERGKIKQRKGTTHRMLMETFDPIYNNEFLEVNHIDGDKSNNNINNLEWITPSENIKHAINNGLRITHDIIGKTGRHRALTIEEAKDIRKMHSEGYSIKQINEKYPNISSAAIQNIYHNRTYNK